MARPEPRSGSGRSEELLLVRIDAEGRHALEHSGGWCATDAFKQRALDVAELQAELGIAQRTAVELPPEAAGHFVHLLVLAGAGAIQGVAAAVGQSRDP